MGITNQPAFILQYGDPKLGKTTDDLLSFPRAFFVAQPGALKPSVGVCGYEPKESDVFDAPSIKATAERIEKLPMGQYDACIVDDLTLLVDRTVTELAKLLGGYDLWGAVHKHLLILREIARRAKIHVVLNCHAVHPRIDNGTRLKGGPALPGKALPYKIPAACDMVLRAVPAPPQSIAFGWPVMYRCDPSDGDWISGDRHNVTPDPSPMNLGELLRLAGFTIRRLPGLDWQEPFVEKVSGMLKGRLADENFVKEVLAKTFEVATSKYKAIEQHAVWTQRDAYDRAVLRNALSIHRRRLYG